MDKLMCFVNKYKLILILFLIVVVIGLIFICNNQNSKEEVSEISQFKTEEAEETLNTIKINIKGAVKNPGVYEIKSDSRVDDAIKAAGGLSDEADTSIINLSRKLIDESVVIIYTSDEVKKIKQGNIAIQYIENECNCPEYENSACIDPDTLVNDNKEETNISGKISINKATIDELQTLSGIGESKAKAIIEYRNSHGNFKSIEEIKNVTGIGNAIFNKIKDDITV